MITAFLPWILCQVPGFRCFVVLASVKTGVCVLISVFLDIFSCTFIVNPKPQRACFFSIAFEEGWGGGGVGLIETEDLCELGGVLFNLAKTMVSVLHKELEYKADKLKYKKLEVMQPMIKNKSELPAGE